MTVAPQVAMRKASQIWQVFFPSQTFHVFFFSFAKPSDFWFGPSQKGTYVVVAVIKHFIQLPIQKTPISREAFSRFTSILCLENL
jgi:hypothetical protein